MSKPGLRPLVLVVEDDPDIAELVQYNLEREGFAVAVTGNGETALREASARRPALVLLDLMLPGLDGLEVCRRLKEKEGTRAIPIVMLTAKGEEADVVLGLSLGADDYVTKPFRVRELLARARAVLRRGPSKSEEQIPERLEVGPILLDAGRHEVFVQGRPVELTRAEFRLLRALLAHPGRVFTRSQLTEKITAGEAIILDRNVDVHVRAIRKKLGRAADLLLTVRGVGYKCRD